MKNEVKHPGQLFRAEFPQRFGCTHRARDPVAFDEIGDVHVLAPDIVPQFFFPQDPTNKLSYVQPDPHAEVCFQLRGGLRDDFQQPQREFEHRDYRFGALLQHFLFRRSISIGRRRIPRETTPDFGRGHITIPDRTYLWGFVWRQIGLDCFSWILSCTPRDS